MGLERVCSLGLQSPATRLAVAKVSALFVLDSFAGGLVMQSFLVAWFARVWGWGSGPLGSLMMGANLLGGASSIVSGYLVVRYGAVNTAVFTHLPSNFLLALVPLMPSAGAAAGLLLARFCLSQMDVPARQAFVQSLVQPSERSAAGGVTNVVRSVGLALAPLVLGSLARSTSAAEDAARQGGRGGDGSPSALTPISYPFFIAALLKCVYDVGLYKAASSIAVSTTGKVGSGSAQFPGTSASSSISSGSANYCLSSSSSESSALEGGSSLEDCELGEKAAGSSSRAGKEETKRSGAEGGVKGEAALGEEEVEEDGAQELSGLLGEAYREEAEREGEAWVSNIQN